MEVFVPYLLAFMKAAGSTEALSAFLYGVYIISFCCVLSFNSATDSFDKKISSEKKHESDVRASENRVTLPMFTNMMYV